MLSSAHGNNYKRREICSTSHFHWKYSTDKLPVFSSNYKQDELHNHYLPALHLLLCNSKRYILYQYTTKPHNITFLTGSAEHTSLQVSENNGSSVFVELLRGRDGLPGRDGVQGPPGPPGQNGSTGPPGPSSGGVTYTRWGKSSCPEVEDTRLVYYGMTGGTQHYEHGGGANHLCMPEDPEYSDTLKYEDGEQGAAHVYGSEYQDPILQGKHDHNVPCAVCYVSTRQSVLMIPAKVSCPKNWTREYYGYLMTEHKYHRRSMFECADKDLEPIPNSRTDTNGASCRSKLRQWPSMFTL